MNRRGFLGSLLKAGAAFAILPAAATYARTWKPTASGLVIPQATALIQIPISPRYHTIWLTVNPKISPVTILGQTEKLASTIEVTIAADALPMLRALAGYNGLTKQECAARLLAENLRGYEDELNHNRALVI